MGESSLFLTALGGASQAYTSYEAGQSNSAIDQFNARNSRKQAEQSLQAGGMQAARVDTRETILRGQQTAGFAGQGVLVGAGTARSVVAGSEAVSEMDKLMIGINARRQAYGYEVAAANSDFQAHLAKVRGNEEALGSLVKTGATMNYEHVKEGSGGDTGTKSLLADESYGAGDYNGGMHYGPNMAFT